MRQKQHDSNLGTWRSSAAPNASYPGYEPLVVGAEIVEVMRQQIILS